MRVTTVTHEEIYKALVEKNEQVKEGRELSEQIEKLEEERNKIGLQIQKLKDRIIPEIEEIIKGIEMSEYEAVGEVRAGEQENEVEIEIFDQIEAYKEFLDDKKKEKEVAEDGNGEV